MKITEAIARQIDDVRRWTLMLIADLHGDDWHHQPGPGLAHPLYLCGHLAFAQNLLVHVRCLETKGIVEESFGAHFPIGAPIRSAREHRYPPVDEVLAVMHDVHARTLTVVRSLDDAILSEPAFGKDGAPHPHYRDKLGLLSHCARHEAFHAGQIATIRRLLGKPFLR
jgi:uncharacterized damage-inducible protein DinB